MGVNSFPKFANGIGIDGIVPMIARNHAHKSSFDFDGENFKLRRGKKALLGQIERTISSELKRTKLAGHPVAAKLKLRFLCHGWYSMVP